MNEFVYHGSPDADIKIFEPRESTQRGNFVYATENIAVAGIFGFRASSLERSLTLQDGKLIVCERVEDYFKINDKAVYIYQFSSKDFVYFDEYNWGKHEVRTAYKVLPLKVFKYESGLQMLQKFAEEGLIDLYLFPHKPKNLSDKNYDLIKNAFGIYTMNTERNGYILEELRGYHSEFSPIIDFLKEKIDSLPNQEKREYVNQIYDDRTGELSQSCKQYFKDEEI